MNDFFDFLVDDDIVQKTDAFVLNQCKEGNRLLVAKENSPPMIYNEHDSDLSAEVHNYVQNILIEEINSIGRDNKFVVVLQVKEVTTKQQPPLEEVIKCSMWCFTCKSKVKINVIKNHRLRVISSALRHLNGTKHTTKCNKSNTTTSSSNTTKRNKSNTATSSSTTTKRNKSNTTTSSSSLSTSLSMSVSPQELHRSRDDDNNVEEARMDLALYRSDESARREHNLREEAVYQGNYKKVRLGYANSHNLPQRRKVIDDENAGDDTDDDEYVYPSSDDEDASLAPATAAATKELRLAAATKIVPVAEATDEVAAATDKVAAAMASSSTTTKRKRTSSNKTQHKRICLHTTTSSSTSSTSSNCITTIRPIYSKKEFKPKQKVVTTSSEKLILSNKRDRTVLKVGDVVWVKPLPNQFRRISLRNQYGVIESLNCGVSIKYDSGDIEKHVSKQHVCLSTNTPGYLSSSSSTTTSSPLTTTTNLTEPKQIIIIVPVETIDGIHTVLCLQDCWESKKPSVKDGEASSNITKTDSKIDVPTSVGSINFSDYANNFVLVKSQLVRRMNIDNVVSELKRQVNVLKVGGTLLSGITVLAKVTKSRKLFFI